MPMRSWVRQLFTRPVPRTIRKAPRRVRLALEALEERCCPSTIVVNNPTDTPIFGQIDLRQAIVQANTTGGPRRSPLTKRCSTRQRRSP